MRKTLRSVLLATLCISCVTESHLVAQPAPDASAKGLASPGASVAIFDLFNLSNNPDYDSWETLWGRGIRRSVFAQKELKVVPFPQIHSALKELKVDDYYIAPEQVPPLGKKLGADFVVLGSFTVSKDMIAASIKVIDGKTGRLLKEETRFAEAGKPNDFISDLSNTLLKILLGSEAVSAPQAEPVTGEAAPDQVLPLVTAPPVVPPDPAGVPLPSAPPSQGLPSGAEEMAPPEILGPEEIDGAPVAAPGYPPPSASPAPGMAVQQAPQPAVGQPQTLVRPIEAEIPSMPRTGPPAQAVQSPFQPMPVLPAPPPPARPYSPPAQYQMPPPGGQFAPPIGPSAQPGMAYQPPQQPQAYTPSPAAVQEEGRLRRFLNWVSRPFRPAENLPPPQVAPPAYTQPAPAAPNMQQPMPMAQPMATPAPQGNAVTRFFGRMFGRGSS